MIIWIDGTYGVGKTTITNKIADKLNKTKFIVLDSDYYFQEFGKGHPEAVLFGGVTPQHNLYFLNYFKSIIEAKTLNGESAIIAMAATTNECNNTLIDYLSEREDFIHIILEANDETIISRISKDTKESRDKRFAIDFLNENTKFLTNNYYEAIRVNTDNKTIDYVVDEIILHINLTPNYFTSKKVGSFSVDDGPESFDQPKTQ